ncbi:hypothetical protein Tsubulata_023489 [Turnera subulata]|uniref:PCI domain-containing protein n=1 Tax=Turnera subulata TaxID=218843 RepID=A0A9Q0GED0_9ROSI|nr:hypothetical protein Tsubulata_023489 [Turnera subulata]
MAMEIEQQQSDIIKRFVDQASSTIAGGDDVPSSLATLVVQATSHPSLFAFSEILSALELQGTESSSSLDLLRLFAYGTWRDYNSNGSSLPELTPEQVLKLKQLTILSLAETNKVLSYDVLLEELEVPNVRELEDFLIDECIYSGIVKGKLNQLDRCLQVQFAAGRDPMDGKLESMIKTLDNWMTTSTSLVPLIEEKIEWASEMCRMDQNHKKEVKERIEIAENHFKAVEFLCSFKPQRRQGYNPWQHEGHFGGGYFGGMDQDEEYSDHHIHHKRYCI